MQEDGVVSKGGYVAFRFHGNPAVVEVGLMGICVVYQVGLYRVVGTRGEGNGEKGKEKKKKSGEEKVKEVVASASSTWRQGAGGQWVLCAMHVQFCEEVEEEEG
jgi:hypothetical protein